MKTSNPSQLVAWGISHGWIKFRANVEAETKPKFDPLENCRARRKYFIEQGLAYNGKPRKHKSWPELKGLIGKEYKRAYDRLRKVANLKGRK